MMETPRPSFADQHFSAASPIAAFLSHLLLKNGSEHRFAAVICCREGVSCG